MRGIHTFSPPVPLYIVTVCNNIGYMPPMMALIKNTSNSSLIARNGNHLSGDEGGKEAGQKLAMKRSTGRQEMAQMITGTWTTASPPMIIVLSFQVKGKGLTFR